MTPAKEQQVSEAKHHMTNEQADRIDSALRLGLAYCAAVERDLKPNQSEEAKRDLKTIRAGIEAMKEVTR